MNATKIQINLLKELWKPVSKRNYVCYSQDSDFVYLGTKYSVEVIPVKDFFIDLEKAFEGKAPFNFSRLMGGHENLPEATLTDTVKVVGNGKCLVFQVGDSETWVDEKLFSNFDLKNSTFRNNSKKEPVFVYEDEVLVGIVLPVSHT